ncbi:Hypothetical predicted protein [Octopus vulgaris]|uniref:Uncharacterized protein n=1 Tax=Octopus vulgaris TaxID=6645 RepID=A0AA36F1X8_OCTVU|nr:Hypothetical predicted protein [Octopus vulgaris]
MKKMLTENIFSGIELDEFWWEFGGYVFLLEVKKIDLAQDFICKSNICNGDNLQNCEENNTSYHIDFLNKTSELRKKRTFKFFLRTQES